MFSILVPHVRCVALFCQRIHLFPSLVVALHGFARRSLQVLLRQVEFGFADREKRG